MSIRQSEYGCIVVPNKTSLVILGLCFCQGHARLELLRSKPSLLVAGCKPHICDSGEDRGCFTGTPDAVSVYENSTACMRWRKGYHKIFGQPRCFIFLQTRV